MGGKEPRAAYTGRGVRPPAPSDIAHPSSSPSTHRYPSSCHLEERAMQSPPFQRLPRPLLAAMWRAACCSDQCCSRAASVRMHLDVALSARILSRQASHGQLP